MARIAITDGISDGGRTHLEKLGHEVVIKFYTEEELMSGALSSFDAVIVRSATTLTKKVIESSKARLRVIGRAGVGVDNIDLKAAGESGIVVVNAPSASTQSVVELTIGHLLSSVRNIARSDRSIRQGLWLKSELQGSELAGKSLGLVGFGRIAQSVGAIARAMGMIVHAFDPYLPAKVAKTQNTRLHKTVESLFSNCTHVSIHCNLNEETRHLIDYEMISKMPQKSRDGVNCGNHIVNCARGGIVNEQDLLKALNDGTLTTAALDVFEIEPVASDYDLCHHPNFHGTPHIGASTMEAQNRVGIDIVKNVLKILDGKKSNYIVNQEYM